MGATGGSSPGEAVDVVTPDGAGRAALGLALAALAAVTAGPLRAQPADAGPAAGNVVGTVVDAESGEPLPGAAVTLAPRPEGLVPGADRGSAAFPPRNRTVLTGEDGRYRFVDLGEGEYLLRITRLGYRPATVSLELPGGRAASVSVGLEMKPVRLTPLSVSGDARNPYGRSRASGPREEVTHRPAAVRLRQRRYLASDARSVTHADVTEANTVGETDLFRALQRLPGVATVDDWTALMRVRGGQWDGTRVYFDGLPLLNPLHAGTVLSAVNADAVGSLFFHPGVRAPELGGGASSVVDVTSRKGGGGEGTRGYGELSLLSARLALDRPLPDDRGGVMVAARRSYADLLVPALTSDEETGLPYALTDVTGRVDLALGGSKSLEASVLWQRDDLYDDIGDVAQGNRAGWGNLASRVTYRHPLFGLRGRHTLGFSRYGLDVDTVPPDPELEERFNTTDLEPTDSRVRHLLLRGIVEPRQRDARGPGWSGGYELVARSARYEGPVPVLLPGLSPAGHIAHEDDLYRGAIWGDYRWRPLKQLEVRAGLRLEAGEPVENAGPVEPAPRLRARFRVSPDLTVSAAAGRHYQYVQSTAVGGGHPGSSIHPARDWRLADEGTPALRTDLVTVGSELWLGPRWLAGVTAYRRWTEGRLTPAVREGVVASIPVVEASESARGVELSLRRLAGSWTMSASYSYGLADLTAAGVTHPAPTERRHLVDVTTMWRPASWFRVGAAYSAGSGVALTRVFDPVVRRNESGDVVESFPRLGEPGGARGPGYSRLDLVTEFDASFDGWSLAVYLQLRNALGRENERLYRGSTDCSLSERQGSFPCATPRADVVDEFEMGLPRFPLLGFRVAF